MARERRSDRAPTVHSPVARLAIGLLTVLAAATCVAEKPRTGITHPPNPAGGGPDNPLNRPAGPSAAQSSSTSIAVKRLGALAYDGLTLPLVAPDGSMLAVQEGSPPDWATILAEPGQSPPRGTRFSVWRIDAALGSMQRVPLPASLPRGLVLGRGSDDRGFLVESPRRDGTRWIGRVPWPSARAGAHAQGIEWLVSDGFDNAHAVITAAGDLAYTRRPAGSAGARELVLRAANGQEWTVAVPRGTVLYPMFASAEPRRLAAVVVDVQGGATLRMGRVAADGSWNLPVEGSVPLSARADPYSAFQFVAGLDAAVASGAAGCHLVRSAVAASVLAVSAEGLVVWRGGAAAAATVLSPPGDPQAPRVLWSDSGALYGGLLGEVERITVLRRAAVPVRLGGHGERFLVLGSRAGANPPTVEVLIAEWVSPDPSQTKPSETRTDGQAARSHSSEARMDSGNSNNKP